jgi:uncharacterized membrane protein (UPF0127 family)
MTAFSAVLRRSASLFLVLALVTAGICKAEITEANLMELDSFPKATLDIHSGKETNHFDIWIAETPAQQQQGLMFVRDLPAARGMLFIAKEPRVFQMWMKNTYIPLDMVFIGADGRIASIAENTTPHSLAIVSSKVPVAAILELKGGEAARRALHVGDKVSWQASH